MSGPGGDHMKSVPFHFALSHFCVSIGEIQRVLECRPLAASRISLGARPSPRCVLPNDLMGSGGGAGGHAFVALDHICGVGRVDPIGEGKQRAITVQVTEHDGNV